MGRTMLFAIYILRADTEEGRGVLPSYFVNVDAGICTRTSSECRNSNRKDITMEVFNSF